MWINKLFALNMSVQSPGSRRPVFTGMLAHKCKVGYKSTCVSVHVTSLLVEVFMLEEYM